MLSILLIICLQLGDILTECPPKEMLSPCTCKDDDIKCEGNIELDLANIFQKMSQSETRIQKHFKRFYAMNKIIKELPENTFKDFTFDVIYFDTCHNLAKIHENAFGQTNLVTKSITFWRSPKLSSPDNSIFNLVSKFINAEYMVLSWLNISEVPAHAFKPINGLQDKLKYLEIRGPSFTKIDDNAFYSLNNLTELRIWDTKNQLISKNVFAFERKSDEVLTIRLTNCTFMKNFNFEQDAFLNLKRPANLIINGNGNPYLEEKVFLPFLLADERNVLTTDQLLDCNDCRNVWLKKYKAIHNRVKSLTCSNSKLLTDSSNFVKCIKLS